MPKIDVVDEAVIDASPMVVCKAILDEFAGLTDWYMPNLEAKPRKDSLIGGENMISDIIVHVPPGSDVKMTQKITKVEEGKSINIEYISGDFLGTGVYTFEPIDRKTRVSFRWTVRPNKLLFNILSPIAKRSHSNTMKYGYKSLNQYLNKN